MQCLHAYIYTFIKAPFTGLFSHNMLKLKKQDKGNNMILYMKQKPNEINY